MYYRIRGAHSTSYLNDKEYINNELETIDTHVRVIANQINRKNGEIFNNILQYRTLSLIGKDILELKYLRLEISL